MAEAILQILNETPLSPDGLGEAAFVMRQTSLQFETYAEPSACGFVLFSPRLMPFRGYVACCPELYGIRLAPLRDRLLKDAHGIHPPNTDKL